MFPLPVISDRRPFASSALPEFIARMGASDFRSPPPSSSLFRLVRRCALLLAPTIGSPWLPRTLVVRLDADSDPGVAAHACQCAWVTVACWLCETISLYTDVHFGTRTFRGSMTCSLCTSPPFVPTHQALRYRSTCKAQY